MRAMPGELGETSLEERPELDLVDGRFYAGPMHAALRWMRRHEPEVFRKGAHFLLLEDFLLYRLTGRAVTEYGVA